jgi:hypothetical protein
LSLNFVATLAHCRCIFPPLFKGIWTITLAFCLPLAKPARQLAETRPTASILGLHTVSSVVGMLAVNYGFLIVALLLLNDQDWYACRKWAANDVSNASVIGDNYESSVVFLISGYQYVSTAMALNFGYEFRQGWWRNYTFVAAVIVFTCLHFYAAVVPGNISCIWRLNCDNDHVVRGVTTKHMSIQNPFNTTVMPPNFRWTLSLLMVFNTAAATSYEYFVVNGLRRKLGRKRREANKQSAQLKVKEDISLV